MKILAFVDCCHNNKNVRQNRLKIKELAIRLKIEELALKARHLRLKIEELAFKA